MMTDCGSFIPDEAAVNDATIDDLDEKTLKIFLSNKFGTIRSFFTRNLRTVQVKKEFNSIGELEIPYICLVELVVNALVHRSLNWNAPIRIFIFDKRVEIHSPGTFPNGLSVDDIVAGISMPHNNFLFANAIYLLPYTGAGSVIQRALNQNVKLSFSNSEASHEFVITIARNSNSDLDTL